jgi:hypothetical protein
MDYKFTYELWIKWLPCGKKIKNKKLVMWQIQIVAELVFSQIQVQDFF